MTSNIRRASGIVSVRKGIALVSGLLIALAASPAEAVTAAAFYTAIRVPTSLEHPAGYIFGDHLGSPETVNVAEGWFGGGFIAIGSATTAGGVLPRASFDLQLTGSGEQGVRLYTRPEAAITYYYTIVQDAGEPFFGNVPLLISTKGHVSGSSFGGAGIGYLFAEANFNWIGSSSRFAADLTNSTGELSFDESFRKFLTPGKEYSVGLRAWGEAQVYTGQTVEVAGWVDPSFVIDPNFSRAGDFSLHFSPGIGPQVPEPATHAIFGAGLAAMAWRTRKRLRLANGHHG